MPINPTMPDSAGIDSEEFNEGARTVEQVETPVQEPAPERDAPAAKEEPAPKERPVDDDEVDLDAKDDDADDDAAAKAASEAAKELSKRKRGLEGRKETIQQQINAKVRERGEVERTTAAGRAEYAALQREIASMRATRDRLAGGGERETDTRDPSDPRSFDPRRPQGAQPDRRQPWSDPQDTKPREDAFGDFAEYAEAIGRWGAREEVRKVEFQRAQRAEQSDRQRWEETRQKTYAERYQAFAKTNPDFEGEIDREDLTLTAPMVDVVKDSAVGPQMLLHFARNPEDLDRIARLHPVIAFGEMMKLEARLEGVNSGSPQPASHEHSKAPRPIKPVESVNSRRSDDTDIPDENATDDEHFERMNARDEALRKRGVRKGYGVRR